MKKNLQKLIKKEKGAASTLVVFTVIIFVAILMGAYLTVTALQKAQIKSDMRIQDIYSKDIERVDFLYNEIVNEYLSQTENE